MVYGTNRTVMATPDLARLESACRAEGLPVTMQRRAIFELLEGRTDHPTADQVWEAARARMPGLSRTTVYRVLDTFVRLGLVVRTPHPGSAVRFDPRTERHHHLVCTACGRVVDVESKRLDGMTLPDPAAFGFEIEDFSVHMRGVCAACRRRRSGRRSRRN
jgi:Fur family transcriptional regulator, peroxide stress response regulator